MKMLSHIIILTLLITNISIGQEKSFIREYTYKASEMDSKISCRAIAVNQLRSLLLQEIGVYVESEQLLKTVEIGGKFSQDFVEKIAIISAGITKLEVLEEKWDGEIFWMKAKIEINNKDYEESLIRLMKDKQKIRELELLALELKNTNKELAEINKELIKNGRNSVNDLEKRYLDKINLLSSSDYFYNGLVKLENNEFQESLYDFNKAVDIAPSFAAAYFGRAISEIALRDVNEALADLNKAIEINPDFELAYYVRGRLKDELQDYQGAIFDCTKAIELVPDFAEAYFTRGYSKAQLQDNRGAIADYTKVIEIDPYYAIAYNNRASSQALIKNYRKSISDYNKAIELDPKMADAYLGRGISKILMGEKQGGCLDLSKSGELGQEKAYAIIKDLCQ